MGKPFEPMEYIRKKYGNPDDYDNRGRVKKRSEVRRQREIQLIQRFGVVRGSCSHLFVVERFQKTKLCPICSKTSHLHDIRILASADTPEGIRREFIALTAQLSLRERGERT